MYDLETSRIGAPYIYDISSLRVKFINSNGNLIFQLFRDRCEMDISKKSFRNKYLRLVYYLNSFFVII